MAMLYDHPLQNVNEVRYLGVVIDCKLTSTNKLTQYVKRQPALQSDAYLIYVCPVLEYVVYSWAPHAKCNSDKLESVQ